MIHLRPPAVSLLFHCLNLVVHWAVRSFVVLEKKRQQKLWDCDSGYLPFYIFVRNIIYFKYELAQEITVESDNSKTFTSEIVVYLKINSVSHWIFPFVLAVSYGIMTWHNNIQYNVNATAMAFCSTNRVSNKIVMKKKLTEHESTTGTYTEFPLHASP